LFDLDVQPAIVTEIPALVAVHLTTDQDGLAWSIMALNASCASASGDVQVEWRLPELARDRILTFWPAVSEQPAATVVDFVALNRPESFAHLWVGARFSVDLPPGEWITVSGTIQGSPDIDQDGSIAASDVAGVLSAWGGNCCLADVNCDGLVEMSDLVLVLGAMSGE
jgi:hypothetical protein